MAKIGIIYLSISGNTTAIAQWLKELDERIELYPIKLDESIPKSKLMQVVKYGYKTIFNRNISYIFDNEVIDSLDGIIIGAPIWMGRIPSPVRDIISSIDLKDKCVAGYCTYDGDPGDFKDQLFAFTDSPPFSSFIALKEPLKYLKEENLIQLKEMVDSIYKTLEDKSMISKD